MDYGLISGAVLFICLLFFFVLYENKSLSPKQISLIATMSALAGISRVPFAALPNIQPTTFLVIVTGYSFGAFSGFAVGVFSTLVSNMFLGQGPWTLGQMLAWGSIGMMSGALGRVMKRPARWTLSIYAFFCSFLFDYIMNLWYWLFFIRPLTLVSFATVYGASFYFDLLHGTGNFAFAYILGKDFTGLLSRFAARMDYKGSTTA